MRKILLLVFFVLLICNNVGALDVVSSFKVNYVFPSKIRSSNHDAAPYMLDETIGGTLEFRFRDFYDFSLFVASAFDRRLVEEGSVFPKNHSERYSAIDFGIRTRIYPIYDVYNFYISPSIGSRLEKIDIIQDDDKIDSVKDTGLLLGLSTGYTTDLNKIHNIFGELGITYSLFRINSKSNKLFETSFSLGIEF